MKKLLTQTLVLTIALTIAGGALAQSPSNTRQRRTASDASQDKTAAERPATESTDKAVDQKDKSKPAAEVTADGQTNRTDQSSEEAAIVPYYNNFFTSYRLGPEDVISVNVFGQDRYSKQGIKIGPSGRISKQSAADRLRPTTSWSGLRRSTQ